MCFALLKDALEGLQHEFADMQEKYIEGERELVVESEVNLDLVAKKRLRPTAV